MSDLISRQALCEYALNQKDKSVTPNDIMRFPSAQPEEVIPVSWIEAKIERLMMAGDAFNGLSASIIRVMLNEWKREQEGGPK